MAADHHQCNIDMYDNNDCTIGKQLADTLAELHIAYYELQSHGVNEVTTWQLCRAAALHFTLIDQVHSLPFITTEYPQDKLICVQYLSNENNVFYILTNPNIEST